MRMSSGWLRAFTAGSAVVAMLAFAPPVRAASAAPTAAALAAIHIDNFGKVDDTYYRGSQPKGADFQNLSALGVKLVIDLAEEGDPAEGPNARAAGMKFVRIAMNTHEVPSPAVIAQFLSLVNDPANQPVYVHCMGGRHRTGVMTAIYRTTMDGWTDARAFQEMKQYKFGADFLHSEFADFVQSYKATPWVAAAAAPTTAAVK